jgi:hypothetical protein
VAPPTRYKLLAVDIDGTLVGPEPTPRPRAAEALRRAKAAGLAVCLATGRTLPESRDVWARCQLPGPADPVICMGGAVVSEPDTGRTLHIEPIAPDVAAAAAEVLGQWGLAVVAGVDSWRSGLDYYLTAGANAEAIWSDWFSKHVCRVERVESLDEIDGATELLRLSVLIEPDRAEELIAAVRERLGEAVELVSIFAPNYGIHVLECYGRGVHKYKALQYVAQGLRIAPGEIVAIGDDVNDVPMIRRAGLGAAMGNAAESVRAHADHVTDHVGADGLAVFVEKLLDGAFD